MSLDELIEMARERDRTLTPEQREADRRAFVRSFAYGNLAIENPTITREMVNAAADELEKQKNAG